MSPARRGRAFSTTKIKASEFSTEFQMELEEMFMHLEALKSDSVKTRRAAIQAVNEARIKSAQVENMETKIIAAAAGMKKAIEYEPQWSVYRDSAGQITFEGLTERVIRNASRASLHQLGKAVEESDGPTLDLYEDENHDDEDAGHRHGNED